MAPARSVSVRSPFEEIQLYRSSGSFVSSQAMKLQGMAFLAHVGLKSMISPPFVRLGFLARIVCPAGASDERNIVIAHVREGTNRVGSSTP